MKWGCKLRKRVEVPSRSAWSTEKKAAVGGKIQ